MSTTRLEYLATRDERAARLPAGPTVAEALDPAGLILLRVRAHWDRNWRIYHSVIGFTAAYVRLDFEPEVQAALFIDLLGWFPHVDWNRDHQVWIETGCVHAAPDAFEAGFAPDEDLTFGTLPPVLLPDGRRWGDHITIPDQRIPQEAS